GVAQGRKAAVDAGPRSHRPALPGLRRDRPRGLAGVAVVPVLPAVPDGRACPRRPPPQPSAAMTPEAARDGDAAATPLALERALWAMRAYDTMALARAGAGGAPVARGLLD